MRGRVQFLDRKIILLITLVSLFAVSWLVKGKPAPITVLKDESIFSASNGLDVAFFYGKGCPHCAKVEPLIDELEQKYSLQIHRYDIYSNRSLIAIFDEYSNKYGLPAKQRGVPTVFVSDSHFAGDLLIIKNLEDAVKAALSKASLVQQAEQNSNPATAAIDGEACDAEKLDSLDCLSFLTITTAALIDSINPCSIAILVFLIGARVLVTSQKKRALNVGFSFCLAVFIGYFLFGMGLLTVVQIGGLSGVFSLLVGSFTFLVGALYLKDAFFGNLGGFKMEVPESLRPLLMKSLKGVTSPPGAFVMGLVAACFELPCTGGPYLFILGQLANSSTRLQAIPLLLYYNLIFVFPLIVISLLLYSNMFSTNRIRNWTDTNKNLLRFGEGFTMIALSLLVVSPAEITYSLQFSMLCLRAASPAILASIFVVSFLLFKNKLIRLPGRAILMLSLVVATAIIVRPPTNLLLGQSDEVLSPNKSGANEYQSSNQECKTIEATETTGQDSDYPSTEELERAWLESIESNYVPITNQTAHSGTVFNTGTSGLPSVIVPTQVACVDPDNDGFGNPGSDLSACAGSTTKADNCPVVSNPGQEDANQDGKGDVCEPCFGHMLHGSDDSMNPSTGEWEEFGTSLAMGDVNGDGFEDLVVGHYEYGVMVYEGTARGISYYGPMLKIEESADSLAVADVNDDGLMDIILVYSYYTDYPTMEGHIRAYYGRAEWGGQLTTLYVSDSNWYTTMGEGLETVANIGDTNADGVDDIIVGAPESEMAFVFYGSTSGLPADHEPNEKIFAGYYSQYGTNFYVSGELGSSVAKGGRTFRFSLPTSLVDEYMIGVPGASIDLNGDDKYTEYNIGVVLIGPRQETEYKLLSGDNLIGASFGAALGNAGDVNGDGYPDVIITASHSAPDNMPKVFVYMGNSAGIELDYSWSVQGIPSGPGYAFSGFGESVGTAGDLNGDGYDDIMVADPSYNPDNAPGWNGRVYIWFGGPSTAEDLSGLGLNQTPLTADIILDGDYNEGTFGATLVSGDINGDHYSDIAVGDPIAVQGQLPNPYVVGQVDVYLSGFAPCDVDFDSIPDKLDNCPRIANQDQADSDSDGLGDVCDNCPLISNSLQTDSDADGLGDVCDPCPRDSKNDEDGDGVCVGVGFLSPKTGDRDNCPTTPNPDQASNDDDGLGDACDNCPHVSNPDQADMDRDETGDVCDLDVDGDNVPNSVDNCLIIPNSDQKNSDADSFGDACDNCPFVTSENQNDADDDKVGDVCDNCANISNPDQADSDRDGHGEVCDCDDTNPTAYQVCCGDTITESIVLEHDLLNCPANGITIGANSIILDGNGHTISGRKTAYGVVYAGYSVTVKNLNVRNFNYGIYFNGSSTQYGTLAIFSSNVSFNNYGIYLEHSPLPFLHEPSADISYNTIFNNTHGIAIYDSDNCRISWNVVLKNSVIGIYFDPSSDHNLAYSNIVCKNYADIRNEGEKQVGGDNTCSYATGWSDAEKLGGCAYRCRFGSSFGFSFQNPAEDNLSYGYPWDRGNYIDVFGTDQTYITIWVCVGVPYYSPWSGWGCAGYETRIPTVPDPWAMAYYLAVFRDMAEGGECFGMSSKFLDFYYGYGDNTYLGYTEPSDFQSSAQVVRDLKHTDSLARSIDNLQGTQLTLEVIDYLLNSAPDNANAVLASVKSDVKNDDMGILMIKKSLTEGHAIVPYAVMDRVDSARIYVYDSNRPYTTCDCRADPHCGDNLFYDTTSKSWVGWCEDGLYEDENNYPYVEINKTTNSWYYLMGSLPAFVRTVAPNQCNWEDWPGKEICSGYCTDIYYIPGTSVYSTIKSSRTLPNALNLVLAVFGGEATGLVADENGNRFGVDEQGNQYMEIPGAKAIPIVANGSAQPLIIGLKNGNYKADIFGTGYGNYSNYYLYKGVAYGIENVSSNLGTKDHIDLVFDGNNPNDGQMLLSTGDATKTFSARIVKEFPNGITRTYRIVNSDLYAGDTVLVKTTPDSDGIVLTNRGSHTLTYDIELSTNMVGLGSEITEMKSLYKRITVEPMTTNFAYPTSWLNLSEQKMKLDSLVCGDGVCSEGENHLNCPEDCEEVSCVMPYDNMEINSDTKLCYGNYTIDDQGNAGVIVINKDDVELDCNGATLNGNGTGIGIVFNNGVNHAKLHNCGIRNYHEGIALRENANNNEIFNNFIEGNTGEGIRANSSSYNTIYENMVRNNQVGILLQNSENNQLNNNHFCDSIMLDINLIDSTENNGVDNTCDKSDGWNDTGHSGCTYLCHYPDKDDDGIPDIYDNCPADYNPSQEDSDHDGVGNACDQKQTFDIFLSGTLYQVSVATNSTVSTFSFNQTEMQIAFTLTGESNNTGYCNVTIPKSLLKGIPWIIRLDDAIIDFNEETNDTHTFLYFTFTHTSPLKVTIEGTWTVPESSSPIILVTLSLVTVALIKLRRKRRKLLLHI